MTIQIELTPEMEARMAAEAKARGLALESYAEALLEKALKGERAGTRSSQNEFRLFLDRLSEGTLRGAPADENISRESIYDDHD